MSNFKVGDVVITHYPRNIERSGLVGVILDTRKILKINFEFANNEGRQSQLAGHYDKKHGVRICCFPLEPTSLFLHDTFGEEDE